MQKKQIDIHENVEHIVLKYFDNLGNKIKNECDLRYTIFFIHVEVLQSVPGILTFMNCK